MNYHCRIGWVTFKDGDSAYIPFMTSEELTLWLMGLLS